MPSTTLTLSINATGYTNNLWTSPANGLVSNNAYASVVPGATSSRTLTYDTNAASVIPANAVITGVRMNVEYRVSTAGTGEVMFGGPGASGGTAAGVSGSTTDTVYVFGGTGNPLGATSRGDLTVFSVKLYQGSNGSVTHYIDNAAAYVDWEYPATVNPLFFGENF